MAITKEYINKALGNLPAKRVELEKPGAFIKGEIRNDDNPNDTFADKVVKPKST